MTFDLRSKQNTHRIQEHAYGGVDVFVHIFER